MLRFVSVLAVALVLASAPAFAEDAAPYPLDHCPVSGKKIGADSPSVVHEGREIKFCCGGCPAKLKADPAGLIAKIDAEIVKQQGDSYPLDTCVVSGHGLKDMGEPIVKVYANRVVKLCCEGCEEGFAKDPAGHFAKIDAAIVEKQLAGYPSKTCPVSGKELTDSAKNVVFAGKLVRFCCGNCAKSMSKDPHAILSKVFGEAKS